MILAGGYGSRLSEETYVRPKPMVEIGGRPMLWHILKIYGHHGITDFIICCGYKGYAIKEYFANYVLHMSDVTVDMASDSIEVHNRKAEPWRVTLVDTGEATMTGGRVRRVADHIDGDFCLTYGDGLSDVDLTGLVKFHEQQGCEATMTAVRPTGRYGALVVKGNRVTQFQEKPEGDRQWINGGFMVCRSDVLQRIEGDSTIFERGPLEGLAEDGQLAIWKHEGFWQAMDTLRDKNLLEELWASGSAPWRVWGTSDT